MSEDDEPASTYQAREMGWYAAFYLAQLGDCRHRFYYRILPRCALCLLFDRERAIRDALGEKPPPGLVFDARPQRAGAHARRAPAHARRRRGPQLQCPRLPATEWSASAGEDEKSEA